MAIKVNKKGRQLAYQTEAETVVYNIYWRERCKYGCKILQIIFPFKHCLSERR